MALMLHSGVALPQDSISQPFRPIPRSGADPEANRRSKSHPSQAFRRAPSESQPRARSEEGPAASPDSWDEDEDEEEDVDSENAQTSAALLWAQQLQVSQESETEPIRAQDRNQAPMPDMRRLGEEARRGPQRQAGPHSGVPSPVSLQAWFEELAQNRTPTENYMDQDPTATASGLPHWFIPGHAGAPMDTSGVQQLTPTQTLRAIHPTARDRRQGRRSVSAPRLSRGHHVPPERRNPLPVRRSNMPNNLLDFRSIRVFSPLTPLAREMQMFHRATGAQVSARPAAEQVFTMERLREITAERLRMMQGGPFAMSAFAGAPAPAPWPGQRGLGLSPEELLTVRTVWKVSRESELCTDFDCCAICLDGSDDKRELIALPCEHVFCADCLCTWLARNPTCVLCKKDMRLAVAKLRRWHRTSGEDSAQT
ncbi:Rnf130 [Symbiodinium sp. CCMP2456]|nr:Rnf130 [Symbiodinium sp. CCMP2456]